MANALVTPADVRLYLNQVPLPISSGDPDLLMNTICDRAASTVREALGFDFAPYPSVPAPKVIYGTGTPWLGLYAHQLGSVTQVTYEGATSLITGWVEDADGNLYIQGASPFGSQGTQNGYSQYASNWLRQRYAVTANWGYGPAPDSVKEIAVEVAINMWKEKDRGMFSDVIGVDTGSGVAVGYTRAFTNRQMFIINAVKRRYLSGGPLIA